MATTSTSAAVAAIEPVFTEPERLARAWFLAGYTGLTREAYALDLRQYASWCQQNHLRLFQARRADIECFAGDLEARGRARATITRRLCTIAGFYRYAVEEELLDRSPAAHVRRPRLDDESHVTGLDRNELGALLMVAGLGPPADTRSSRCWPSTGCVSPKPPAPTSKPSASSAATAPWSLPARAARWPPSRSRREPRERSTWPSANAPKDQSSWPLPVGGWTGTAPRGSSAESRAAPRSLSRSGRTPCGPRSSPRRWTPGLAARRAGRCLSRRSPHDHEIRPRPRQPRPACHLHCRRLRRWCRT
jgi:hypothetical protein